MEDNVPKLLSLKKRLPRREGQIPYCGVHVPGLPGFLQVSPFKGTSCEAADPGLNRLKRVGTQGYSSNIPGPTSEGANPFILHNKQQLI